MTQKFKDKIKLSETIQDIFDRFPELKFKMITVLSANGLQSVGPESDLNKTLEAAMRAKGASPEKTAALLTALNANIPDVDMPVVQITERAKGKIKELLKKENKEDWGFKFGLKPGGCSGFEYDLRFEAGVGEGEKTYPVDSIKIFIADRDLDKLRFSTIDFEEGLMSSGFQVRNPNATGSCGCGVSNSF